MKYPKNAKTESDSTAYKQGYATGKGVNIGSGRAGISANSLYQQGLKDASKKKYGGSVSKTTKVVSKTKKK